MRFFDGSTSRARRGTKSAMVLLAGALGLSFAVACQDATAVPNTAAVAGNYILTTVNDTALPRIVRKETNYTLAIVEDTLALSPYGTWADLTIYSETSGAQTLPATNLAYGKFSVSGSTLNFVSGAGEKFTGSVSSNSVVITGSSKALYVKH